MNAHPAQLDQRAMALANLERHHANLAEMKVSFEATTARMKGAAKEAADRAAADYATFIASFEAGLLHFAEQTGLRAEGEAVLAQTSRQPVEPHSTPAQQ